MNLPDMYVPAGFSGHGNFTVDIDPQRAGLAFSGLRVLVLEAGASQVAVGGVGFNIVQMAREFGTSQVIAIDVADDKLEAVKAFGATATINSMTQDAREDVLKLTNGRGVDVSFEALGIPFTWNTALDVLADGGRMVPIGLGAGRQTAEVEINRTVRRSQSILGSYGARTRQDLPAVVDLAARGIINDGDLVTCRFSLDEAAAGYEALRHRTVQGRCRRHVSVRPDFLFVVIRAGSS